MVHTECWISKPQRLVALALIIFPLAAYPQTTLTGAAWFSSTPTGATSVSQGYADGFGKYFRRRSMVESVAGAKSRRDIAGKWSVR